MEIVFYNQYGIKSAAYAVENVDFDNDDSGAPVDIMIKCSADVANTIAEKHCVLGYNYSEEFRCALFGRLESFLVVS